MTSKELRQKYLDFFRSKNHTIISSASLIPENDPTVLFTTAGMHPLVPYLLGEKHPAGNRLTSCQKCIRTSDIDEVGDTTHHTFFEMLGNWSLGDYFKEKSIEMSWEFLTSPDWLNLDKNRIAVSVFAGDKDAVFDQESYDIWKNKIGISEIKIAKLPKKNNWWGPAGLTGPCGPDTEIFYWTGDVNKIPNSFNDDNSLWVEIWNNVFMQYNKTSENKFELLKQQNVDTGMGLERILAIVNGSADNYQTDLFKNIINKIEQLSDKKYGNNSEIDKAIRIIADHLKATVFIMSDEKNISPSNTDRGYIVRRLIRRAIRYGRQLGVVKKMWIKEIAKVVIDDYADVYFELQKNINFIITQLDKEEEKFSKTLELGLKQFENQKLKVKSISGQIAFDLYQTYGFPIEITKELAKESGLDVDEKGFLKYFKEHQDLSRTASAGMFKGGLADASEETIKYHTTAHLMLSALKKVLGNHVSQKGSNITAERLRFDFSHNEKMTVEQLQQVENLVNQAIKQDLIVSCEEMDLEQARSKGATGVFDLKYKEKVKVYTIGLGDNIFSKEICGGPHVNQTGILGKFKIKKEESSSAGVRRIKAILQ
ncbi:MAG: alanine--tRNA ligase [bacterium]|nr:alanine--tRNA ligase [bacterium]